LYIIIINIHQIPTSTAVFIEFDEFGGVTREFSKIGECLDEDAEGVEIAKDRTLVARISLRMYTSHFMAADTPPL
jgi:hypothetical protein